MVAELKQLAEHMDKVIVVSHLEAFNDPVNFPDRLVVERKPDGSSAISQAP
jgi:DNA repair exonuclease SbcCD ATPase subunit